MSCGPLPNRIKDESQRRRVLNKYQIFSSATQKYFPFTFHFEFSLSPHGDYTRFCCDVRLFFAGFPSHPRSYDISQRYSIEEVSGTDAKPRSILYIENKGQPHEKCMRTKFFNYVDIKKDSVI